MIKFCVEKWTKNENKLREAVSKDTEITSCDYLYLIKLVTKYILNGEDNNTNTEFEEKWGEDEITVVDNGDYQGTLMFLIPLKTCQPSESEYLLTYADYGSCSVCDTLQGIQAYSLCNEVPTEEQIKDFMSLCRDLVMNMIKPYNIGWRASDDFEEIKYDVYGV